MYLIFLNCKKLHIEKNCICDYGHMQFFSSIGNFEDYRAQYFDIWSMNKTVKILEFLNGLKREKTVIL